MKTRRRQPFAGLVAMVAVLGLGLAGGWYAAGRFRSPAQIEAAATAPTPEPITAQVQQGDLAQTITARTALARAAQEAVPLTLPADVAVVTATPAAAGATVSAGSVLTVINDRPVIVLPGAFPLFRDLRPGDTGADVRQLQDGLRAWGATIRERELGTFGAGTIAAIKALYRAAGFTPATETTEAPATTTTDTDSPATTTTVTTTVVPRAEICVVGTLPAVVSTTPKLGDVLDTDTAKVDLASGSFAAQASVAVSVVGQIAAGDTAVVSATDGTRVEATVTGVVVPTVDGDPAQVLLTPTTDPFPDGWTGLDLLTTITVLSAAQDSLIVPSSAVEMSGGTTHVLKQTPTGFEEVAVQELATLDGRSAIRPTRDGDLVAGDEVRVA